ncbi:probable mitochondrial adenine nucleotide transporter BTL1 isoform X2 [Phalaenopsis equestris]|uniref:probable mitochondrial adenine nucleotide transporter BTL1 isoform X2 n=2 Tax=Phalaenopsis equestris TaxID=78828 RepID=UPI0009E2DAB0|nr:probable mitochondrial adenine nucleotide transporter BTL1 isoform X2 [Phalaenopsis equestris]
MGFEPDSSKRKVFWVQDDALGEEMAMSKEIEVVKGAAASPAAVQLRLPDVGLVLRNFVRSREVGEFLSGALAGAMTKAVLAPLETIRTRMIVGVGSKHITGSFLQIIEENGWQGLWAGNTINMVRIVPTQAIELATFESVKRMLTSAQEKWRDEGNPKLQVGSIKMDLSFSWLSPIAVGGAAAGIVSTVVCHPLEVIKDRLTVNREIYPSISLAFSRIYRDDGVRGLYAGIFPTLVGMLPYSTCYYFMYEKIKTSYCRSKKKKNLNRPELLLIGAVSGLTASTISFPLEVARKRLMIGKMQGKCPPNMAAALTEVVREVGFLGLYRGWGASCLKVMPSSGITWMFYEAWKEVLLLDKFKQ